MTFIKNVIKIWMLKLLGKVLKILMIKGFKNEFK